MYKFYTVILLMLLVIIPMRSYADTQIQMEEYGGVFRVPCSVNGAKMKLIFDTGASNVCLSMQIAEYLYDNEYISADDFVGSGSSSVADGRIVDHLIINLKDIEISGLHLHNVQAVVIDGQNAPLLLGQSAIQQLGSIELNGSLLTIHNGEQNNSDFIDDLFEQARNAYDNRMYSVAMEKYGQLHSMNQLSDYGKYKYAWACLMAENPQLAFTILNGITSYAYFEENKIDIYRLLGFVHQDLEKYYEAANYFELSNKKIHNDLSDDWHECFNNLRSIGDCHRYAGNYSEAANKYQLAMLFFGHFNDGIDLQYMQKDCKNQLKKKQKSYRNDDLDYLCFYAIYCMQRSGEWSVDAFLAEAAALARAGNKYATRELNRAGIDPYSSAWY